MKETTRANTPFRDRSGRLIFRGDRVINVRTQLEYTVNNVIDGECLDGVRFEDGARHMCAINSCDAELVGHV